MKKILLFSITLLMLFTVTGCKNSYYPVDYSKVENWYTLGKGDSKEVDTIYIYPTVVMEGGSVTTIEENRKSLEQINVRDIQASAYDKYTNVYMPIYRQAAMSSITGTSALEVCEFLYNNQGYKDLEDALDYYFENLNNDKPFILAGHSQGSSQIFLILTHYMQDHPEYLERMVAAYPIGFGMSKTEIAKYSNLKFATGETDTNCIISYNTFGSEHSGRSLLHDEDSFVINPLNWKTDDTYASKEYSLGSRIKGNKVAPESDAKVDTKKGYLISSASEQYEGKDSEDLFGTHTFHSYDYGFFYYNIEENVGKRINAYLNKK